MKHSQFYKIAFEVFLLAICVFLFCSVLDFHIGDPPSPYVWPQNQPVRNWCGSAGAFVAYYILYYVGPGSLVVLAAVTIMMAANLSGKELTQMNFRLIGMILLTAALSTTWFLLWPTDSRWIYRSGSFPMNNGGILGIAAGTFLRRNMANLGTSIFLVSTWMVGAVLLADSLVLGLIRSFGRGVLKLFGLAGPALTAAREQSHAFGDIWKRLSEKQKQEETSRLAESLKRKREESDRIAAAAVSSAPAVHVEEKAEQEELFPDHDRSLEKTVAAAPSKPEAAEEVKKKPPKVKPTPAPAKNEPLKTYDDYQLPPLNLLKEPEPNFTAVQERMVEDKARTLEELLKEFGVNAEVVNAEPGPAITMYELQLAPGVKVSQISNLSNDMARALSSGMVRVVAPLAGKHTIGIEVPNSQRETVRLKDLVQKGAGRIGRMQIPLFLGKSSSGEALVSDLAGMPHLLIAGTTGSGKSVCINSIITSILLTKRPDEVKLILIDPKMVEMAAFESIPHLMCPTVTEMRRAEQILEWAVEKMDERYELLAEAKVRNVASYNTLTHEELLERFQPSTPQEEAMIPKKLPHIVIIIDELADLMMTSAKEVEAYIVRIAQKSRAVGIHLVLATQRPQATVVTGLIKANMPSRIAFRVAARMDSRIILDQNGAETLLGQGDMLFLIPGTSDLMRAQGAYLDDDEIRNVVKFLKDVAQPQYSPELMQLSKVDLAAAQNDDLFDDAVRVVLETQRGSVSLLQRRLSIGYARASRMIELMAQAGILGEYRGSQAREVTMTLEEYEARRKEQIAEEVQTYDDLTARTDEDGEDEETDEEEYITQTEIIEED